MKIDHSNGYWWVKNVVSSPEGVVASYTVWGGTKDPSGHRQYRSVKPEYVKADKRKLERKAYPGFAL